MRYIMEISYLRLIPWWRRWACRLVPLDWWDTWYKWLVPVANWLRSRGFNRWLLLTYDQLEYATAKVSLEVSYTGTWHPPEPEAGYMAAYYDIRTFEYDSITVPGDYNVKLQLEDLHDLIQWEEQAIRDACIQYESNNVM